MRRCYGCFEEYEDELDLCPYCGFEDGEGPEEALHLEPGRMLKDTYIVGKVLGYGGFGVTYLGWNSVLEQKVAIKEYLPNEFATRMPGQTKVTVFNGDKSEQFLDGVDKFVDEANRLVQFRSTDGIVRIFESFKENNTAYIVMEYLDGETLTKYLEKTGQLPADEAVRLMTPIIQSLQIVHEQGIIHRDIAPDNIMVTKTGEVKLIDFGAARYATTTHSRSLTVVIKQGYSPEEQYRSRGDQGSWTDVYAVGATMYRMITGQTPPDAMERRAFFEGKKKDILAPLTKYSKQISTNQETAILNAMNVRIEDRTPNMDLFEQELNAQEEVKRRHGKIKKIDVLRWPLWTKITIPIVACAVIALSILFITGVIGFDANLQEAIAIPEGMARVPSIVSSDIEKAEVRLTEAVLLSSITGKEYSEDIPANLILTQNLAAGSIVPNNSIVEIKISGGKTISDEDLVKQDENGQLQTADVQYKTKEEAIRLLELQGMKIRFVEESSETVAAGIIISQNPPAGTPLDPGTEVILVISTGGAGFDMPNVAGKSEQEAKAALAAVGLSVTVEYDKDRSVPIGSVIKQNVETGSKVHKGDVVVITVSSGKALISVPNVIGQQRSAATGALEGIGLVAVYSEVASNRPIGEVIAQTPLSGASLEDGGTVMLTVSRGPDIYTVTYNANGGSVNPGSQQVEDGSPLSPPTPAMDYNDFTGWYTAASGGTQVGAGTPVSGNTTLYAQWSPKATSDWVAAASVPAGAQVVNRKWAYTLTSKKESASAAVSGWTQISSRAVTTGSGSIYVGSFPAGFYTSNWYYQNYRQTVPAGARTTNDAHYTWVYWHWCYSKNVYEHPVTTPTNCYISSTGDWQTQGGAWLNYDTFHAFESASNLPFESGANAYKLNDSSKCNHVYWWLPERVDIRKKDWVTEATYYMFQLVESRESAAPVSAGTTGTATTTTVQETISNVQEYVQYRPM